MELGAARIHAFTPLERVTDLGGINPPDVDTIVRAVEQVNESEFLGPRDEITITFEADSKKPILRLVDRETNEVIRQVPAEYLLRLARNFARQKSKTP